MPAGMTRTLTIRLSGPAMKKVKSRAAALGVTPSELVRSVLEREVGASSEGEPSALELTRRFVGAVKSRSAARGRDAREELEGWLPDRRDG